MFGPAWHCLTQFDVQSDSVLQMVLDLGRYLDNHPIPDHEDIVNIIKEIVGTIVTSVNGKTGEVSLKLSDVTGTDSWPVWILTSAEYGEITDAAMLDAYDNDGFRLLYVTAGEDPEKEPAFLMIPGRTFNPDGITRYIFTGGGGSGGGAVQSVNGKVGTVVLTADDVGAATPADVTAVDNKVAEKYGPDNVPPYPVTRVFRKTGDISPNNDIRDTSDGTNGLIIEHKTGSTGQFAAGLVISTNQLSYRVKDDGDNSFSDYTVYNLRNPPPYPVTSVNTKTGEVVLSASDVGAATPADVSAVDAKVDAKYGPDNAPPYPVTGRIDEVGTSSYFVRGSNNVGIAVDGAGNLLGINSSGAAVTMYSQVNPPPASPIPFYYARSNEPLSVASTDTAVPFNDTVYAGAGITHANATFTIPAGSYAISIIINGSLNTSDSAQVTLRTVNASSTLYYVQSYFSASPSNQFVLPWPMQLYYFAKTTILRVIAKIDSGGSIGVYNPYTISIIKLA